MFYSRDSNKTLMLHGCLGDLTLGIIRLKFVNATNFPTGIETLYFEISSSPSLYSCKGIYSIS